MRRTVNVEAERRSSDFDIDVVGGVTIGALVRAVAPESAASADPPRVWIDGHAIDAGARMEEIAIENGAFIAIGSPPRSRPSTADASVELRVVGGLDAGARFPLPVGTHRVGRCPSADVVLSGRSISRMHASIDVGTDGGVTVADLGSTAGTFVGTTPVGGGCAVTETCLLSIGAAFLAVSAPPACEPAVVGPLDSCGRRAFHRPPRPGSASRSEVEPPAASQPSNDPPRFGWAAALVPLAGGIVLAVLVDPRLALFSLLGPLVLIGQWIEERRGHRRDSRRITAERSARLTELCANLDAAADAEVETRRRRLPDPSVLAARVKIHSTDLWARRRDTADFGCVSVGIALAMAWDVPLTRPAEGEARTLVDASRVHGSPVDVDLSRGHHLGIVGERSEALALARWVVMQLAAFHGPSDLRIAVIATQDAAESWAWSSFLPHWVAMSPNGSRLLGAGAAAVARVVELAAPMLDASGDTRPLSQSPELVVVVDGSALPESDDTTLAPLFADLSAVASVTLAASARALPSRCDRVVELSGHDGWIESERALATGLGLELTTAMARSLAGLSDPESTAQGRALPDDVRLLDLLGLGGSPDAELGEAIADRWASAPSTSAVIGIASSPVSEGQEIAPFAVDLAADGPHVLVAGTTGAGKSELLRTLVASLAAASPPDRMTFVLIDYKGGAAFGACRDLPHVVGLVTDLDDGGAERALRSLEAELRSRERKLAALRLRDLADHPSHCEESAVCSVDPLPRLVIVVDELAALVAEMPELVDGLVSIASRGRSLGIHLVLGTQRPAGVVTAAIRTNCTLRVCLRVPDEADAVDIVGTTSPALLDRKLPGRAFVRRGASDLTEVQLALATGARVVASRAPVTVQPLRLQPDPWESTTWSDRADTDLDSLAAACTVAARRRACGSSRRPWVDPLPDALTAAGVRELGATEPPSEWAVAIGLIDQPDEQRQSRLEWIPSVGPLIAMGRGSTSSLALVAAASACAEQLSPDALHIHVLEMGGRGLRGITDLPHVGSVIRFGERERIHRLIRWLHHELIERQASSSAVTPRVLLVVNGVPALLSALDGLDGMLALDALERVIVDGPAVGMVAAVGSDRSGSVPAAWTSAAQMRLAFRLGDPTDLLALGLSSIDQTAWPQARCIEMASGLVAQVAEGGWVSGPPGGSHVGRRARSIEVLGRDIDLADIGGRAWIESGGLVVPLGPGADDLSTVEVRLSEARGLLVVGNVGSGRTTALDAIASAASGAGCVVTRLSRGGLVPDVEVSESPHVVLVDDAEELTAPPSGCVVVAATTPNHLRSAPLHWLARFRSNAAGLLLRPHGDLDGDCIGLPLLPRTLVRLDLPGRGVLVDHGPPVVLHVARAHE